MLTSGIDAPGIAGSHFFRYRRTTPRVSTVPTCHGAQGKARERQLDGFDPSIATCCAADINLGDREIATRKLYGIILCSPRQTSAPVPITAVTMSWREFVFLIHLDANGKPARDALGRPIGARWLPDLERIAQRRFPSSESLAEEAYNEALSRLLDDTDKLRDPAEFAGDDERRFRYFASCFINAIEDFSRHKFGRPRPPTWLRNLGGIWLQLYHWLCLERHSSNAVVERLAEREIELNQQPEALARRDAREMVRTVRGRITNCGEQQLDMPLEHTDADGESRTLELESDSLNPETQVVEDTVQDALGALADLLGASSSAVAAPSIAGLVLEDREAVLLRLVYVDGLNVSKAAKALGWQEHTARRLLNACLERLRTAMEDQA